MKKILVICLLLCMSACSNEYEAASKNLEEDNQNNANPSYMAPSINNSVDTCPEFVIEKIYINGSYKYMKLPALCDPIEPIDQGYPDPNKFNKKKKELDISIPEFYK